MSAIKYINPEGQVVEVPEADAPHFDKIGWEKADAGENPQGRKKKTNTDNNNK